MIDTEYTGTLSEIVGHLISEMPTDLRIWAARMDLAEFERNHRHLIPKILNLVTKDKEFAKWCSLKSKELSLEDSQDIAYYILGALHHKLSSEHFNKCDKIRKRLFSCLAKMANNEAHRNPTQGGK